MCVCVCARAVSSDGKKSRDSALRKGNKKLLGNINHTERESSLKGRMQVPISQDRSSRGQLLIVVMTIAIIFLKKIKSKIRLSFVILAKKDAIA